MKNILKRSPAGLPASWFQWRCLRHRKTSLCAQKTADKKDTACKSKAVMPFCSSAHILNPVTFIIYILPRFVTPTESMNFQEAFNLTQWKALGKKLMY